MEFFGLSRLMYEPEKILYGPKRSSTSSSSFTVTRTPPKVLLTYSYAPKQLGDSEGGLVSSCDASIARQRIEEEVAEVQRRDEELRY